MKFGNIAKFGDTGNVKAVTSVLMLVVAALCLLSIDSLTNGKTRIPESERDTQNTAASALYVSLASLKQPATTTDITRTLLAFTRQHDSVGGTTLLDAQGQLVAQLGSGNDHLMPHPADNPTARIPILAADNKLLGHVVVAFKPARDNLTVMFHYVTIITVSAILVSALMVLLCLHLKRRVVKARRPHLSWRTQH